MAASIHHEVDAHVDAPLDDTSVIAGDDLDVVDPGAADVLHRLGNLAQTLLYRIFDAVRRRTAELDDLRDRHGDSPWLSADDTIDQFPRAVAASVQHPAHESGYARRPAVPARGNQRSQ